MKRGHWIGVAVLLVLVAILCRPMIYRQGTTIVGETVVPTRVHRMIGYTEWFVDGRWVPAGTRPRRAEPTLTSIPAEELAKIWVNGITSPDGVSGEILNGSKWVVRDLEIQVVTTDKGGSAKREFSLSGLSVRPLEARAFQTKAVGLAPGASLSISKGTGELAGSWERSRARLFHAVLVSDVPNGDVRTGVRDLFFSDTSPEKFESELSALPLRPMTKSSLWMLKFMRPNPRLEAAAHRESPRNMESPQDAKGVGRVVVR